MTGYLLSRAAQADLSEIWDYSARNWGEEQADRYILAIRDACAALADGSRPGRGRDE
ncbi:MAG: type II toxin-antitoxin system RelE/ParE family toxin [Acetobacteraceae bacterium]